MSVQVFVGLGANLGDRGEALLQALKGMAVLPHTQLLAVSSLYSSAPVDATGPDYLNAVAMLETALSPEAFLQLLQALEQAAGRERPYRNAPRTLDLDVLLWGTQQLNTSNLIVPHPRMYERAFVLKPLAELDATQVSAAQLAAVADQRITVAQDAQWAAAALPT
ncbi:MAG TPA: 2-amino-4-hydroxy-6-hydroxymethyldihydropteridine diphosphokinase [Comamonas sp.]